MSIQPHARQQYPCEYCESAFDPATSIKDSFCSLDCYHRHRGEQLLRKIRHDHRFCATCYRVRKEIDRPPDPWLRKRARLIREAVIGFEYPTPNLHHGPGFTYCECGSVDHTTAHEWVRDGNIRDSIENCLAVLHQLYHEGQLDTQPDKYRLVRTLYDNECDWALAIGRALFAASSA